MYHVLQILLVFITLIAGCAKTPHKPDVKGVKIGDLAPIKDRSTKDSGRIIMPQSLKTTNIDIVTYELQPENINQLDGIWHILKTSKLKFNDYEGFTANGLRAAAGEFGNFEKVRVILKSAGAKQLFTTALWITRGQAETLNISQLTRKTTVSYIYQKGIIKNAQVGPAIGGLQVTARQIPGATAGEGPVNIQFLPAILASTEGLPPELAARLKEKDIYIYSGGFSAMMKPGDFILMTPREYKPPAATEQDESTVAGRFFIRHEPKPAVRLLLIVCTSAF